MSTSPTRAKLDEKYVAIAWIDYKKVYDVVPQTRPKMYKISDEVIKFIEETMKNWEVDETAGGKALA